MAVYEGKWLCTSCNHKNRGPEKSCARCGVARSVDVKFFLEEDAPVVTDEAKIAAARAGADWICHYCRAANAITDNFCKQCGTAGDASVKRLNEREGQASDFTEAAVAARPKVNLSGIAPLATTNFGNNVPQELTPANKKTVFKVLGCVAVLISCFVLGVIFLAYFLFFSTRQIELQVQRATWQRDIEIEAYKQITESDWQSNLPSDAKEVSRERKIHHYNKVRVGTKTVYYDETEKYQSGTEKYVCGKIDKGNGHFEDKYCTRPVYKTRTVKKSKEEAVYREDPVYMDWITYTVLRWIKDRVEQAQGDDGNPQWPITQTDNKTTREGKRTEICHFALQNMETPSLIYSREQPIDWCVRYKSGMRFRARINRVGFVSNVVDNNGTDIKW